MRLLFLFTILLPLLSCKADNKIRITQSPSKPDTTDSYIAIPFQNVPSLEDMVIYEANEQAFASKQSFNAITIRLDEIKSLGVNVIWLMPIFEIGVLNSINSPYCIKNYTALNPNFGTLSDLRTLTEEAHKRNIAIVIDWVANHTSWDNAWIANKSWYTQDKDGNIVAPAGTNWSDVADLNFDNTSMRKAMIEAMKYWIEKANVDGFRCDYADGVPMNFWKQAIDDINALPNRTIIWLAEGSMKEFYTSGFQMTYGWDFYAKIKNIYQKNISAKELIAAHQKEYSSVPTGKQKLRFTTNHDESAWDKTPIVLFNGEKGSIGAFIASSFIGGIPLIYSSQEVGRTSNLPFFSSDIITWNANPSILNEYKKIMNIYTSNSAIRSGKLTDYSTNDVLLFSKESENERFFIFVNTRDSSVTIELPSAIKGRTLENVLKKEAASLGSTIVLANYDYLIFKENI